MIPILIWGFIFEGFGTILIFIATNFFPSALRIGGQGWNKKYSWGGWNPIMIISPPSGKKRLKIKLNHTTPKSGLIPPKCKGSIIGVLFILIGLLLHSGLL